MITFLIGLAILFSGYIIYSRYVEKQFSPDDRKTPAYEQYDGVDYIPLPKTKNMLIQLLNIAGLGPILGAIQGVLFGPVALLLIPLGAVFMGAVHDYSCGMISMRSKGAQVTELIKNYLGIKFYKIFLCIIAIMLIFVTAVFVYTSGDIMAERFFHQSDFSLNNHLLLGVYAVIALYYILAALLPIDKIIGKFYPVFALMLLLGTFLIICGFFIHGLHIQEFSFAQLNFHPKGAHILPMFFMTVSCGLLSGFHSTQSTIISRTVQSEYDAKKIFYGMMCLESFIAMIWAAAAMHVYSLNLVAPELIGKANVINSITDVFVTPAFAFIVTIAVVILPITTGDTALRALRITVADALKIEQTTLFNRLKLVIPITISMLALLIWSKINSDSFSVIWNYFTFVNQLLAIPTFLYATIYLFKNKKNFYITLIPGVFYIFITSSFIFNVDIGLRISYKASEILGVVVTLISLFFIIKKLKTKTVINK